MGRDKDRQAALRALAEEISAVLARGLPQDQDTLDTVLVALGEPDQTGVAAALARLAADPEASEHAPLAALLLTPDPAVLRALEPALARADLDAEEAVALAGLVARRVAQNQAPVLLPALLPGGARAQLAATAEGLRGFVRRLRPEATAPAELRGILARRCAGAMAADMAVDMAVELAVLLRRCRLAWTPERVFFLATLLERADLGRDDLPGLLAWATGFLDVSGQPLELRRALARRRQALLTQLRQAEFQEEALARGSYETLMSQGLRLGHVHGPEVRAELAFLERAAWLALGLPGEALDGVGVRDLGRAESGEELLRLLPGLED